MNCVKCEKELEQDWIVCPFCGTAKPEIGTTQTPEMLDLDCGGGELLKLIYIEPGKFTMGGTTTEAEEPPHEVTIANPFYMGIFPVTQAQYEAVMPSNSSMFRDQLDSAQHPAGIVTWEDAKQFCQRLSQKTGKHVDLPSEAQWEYCCRAGTTTEYSFGEEEEQLERYANYERTPVYGDNSTSPVGCFRPNDWGLYDMHGNVWEWCEDQWHENYDGAPTDGTAWLSEDVSNIDRVYRGGSWYDFSGYSRSAFRFKMNPLSANSNLGFRVCLG